MLILTRRPGETILIDTSDGEQIQVAVLGVKGNQVRVGIEAPVDVVILRKEVADRRRFPMCSGAPEARNI